MAKVQALQFTIHLTNALQVKTLQGTDFGDAQGPGIIAISPVEAAARYHAPIFLPGPNPYVAPCLTSSWFTKGVTYPLDQAEFTRKSGGLFGIPGLFGSTTHYFWKGLFVYDPPANETSGPSLPETIRHRRWIDGFEIPPVVENAGTGGTASNYSRGASRHMQGYGWALRDAAETRSHLVNEHVPALVVDRNWERIYVRPVYYPSTGTQIWKANSVTGANHYYRIDMLPSGQLALYVGGTSSPTTGVLVATIEALPLNRWTRLDLLIVFGPDASPAGVQPQAGLRVFYNGVHKGTIVAGAGYDVAQITAKHQGSQLGPGAGSATYGIDFDDWICAEMPVQVNGADWTHGSRVALIRPTNFSSVNGWSGNWQVLGQNPVALATPTDKLTSSVSSQTLQVTTDALTEINKQPGVIGTAGLVALLVAAYARRASAVANSFLGYTLSAGGALVVKTISLGTGATWFTQFVEWGGGQDANIVTQLEFGVQHSADAIANDVYALVGVGEMIGVFGPEDQTPNVDSVTYEDVPGVHNAPYPRTPWATSRTPPQSPVAVITGTYTGNALGLRLLFKVPVHFWWVRRVTASGEGAHWFSSNNGPHRGFTSPPEPTVLIQAREDPDFVPAAGEDQQGFQYQIEITGTQAQANNAGDTYAYFAFCDPGMRFLVCDVLKGLVCSADRATPMIDST